MEGWEVRHCTSGSNLVTGMEPHLLDSELSLLPKLSNCNQDGYMNFPIPVKKKFVQPLRLYT